MIIWSGHGYLVAIIVFVSSLFMQLVTEGAMGSEFYQQSVWALPLALFLAAGITFAIDRIFFANSDGKHSLFFIPLNWWAPILAIVAVITFGYRVINGGA